ncbi:MAG TPA: M42 family metallopeptidase [Symbiobacteriaceae bacterium]|jgi:putative aminopeptidase FrvX|nr:M42 family metallopeptidase [Symbiobacteriaceae bacterium]
MPQIDVSYITGRILELCQIPSPTGFTEAAIAYMEQEFEKLGVRTRRTRKGALLATLPGRDTANHRTLAAHVDTLGAMVRDIKSNGRLKLTRIGGYSCSTIEGEYVKVHTHDGKVYTGTVLVTKASVHVHGQEHYKQERDEPNMEIRLDERVHNKEDVEKLGIQVGDFISLDPRAMLTPTGFVKSRHLDDKACAGILLGLAKHVVESKIELAATTHLFISNYEETGHGASSGIPAETTELIALDMAAVGEGQSSDEYSVTICVKDSTGPYDYELSRRLQYLASDQGIPYRVDIYPQYGSDASAALRAGGQFKAALVGPGIDASHSYERCHVDSLEHTAWLMLEYLKR